MNGQKMQCVLWSIVMLTAGLGVLAGCSRGKVSDMQVTGLRCEYLANPLGIDEPEPRLGWMLESPVRGQKQAAYRILVASSEENLARGVGDLWDTGVVESDRTSQIVYSGKSLRSRQRCWWNVRAWDRDRHGTAVSEMAFWTMGLLDRDDWKAEWIGMENPDEEYVRQLGKNPDLPLNSPSYLRKAFTVDRTVAHASVYASALGLYELHINGRRVGSDYFTPGWTQYNKRIQYQTYDVTGLIQEGGNVIGAILAEGWYSGHLSWMGSRWIYGTENSLCVQFEIEYADGSSDIVVSDGTWRCTSGPIMYSSLYMGEMYDATKEMPGWDTSGFDDNGWRLAVIREKPEALLVAQRSQPVHVTGTITPVNMSEPKKGVFVFDLGQNIVGWVRLKVTAGPGVRITLRHAERLNADGTIYTANLRTAKSEDVYITRGSGGAELYEPHFTFHGFQYVEVTGFPGAPAIENITGIVVHSDTPPAGTFECSNPLVNRLAANIQWGQRGNFLSVPTDCPQRDERLGWMGDAQVFIRTASYNMDVAAFFTKWMYDVADAQTSEGAFCYISPSTTAVEGDWEAAPAWSDAGVIIPWTIHHVYGDTRIIEKHWNSMVRYMDYLGAVNPDYIRKNKLGGNWGDWLSIDDDTPKYLLATAFWAFDARLMGDMAEDIGKTDDAEKYRMLFARIQEAFQKKYVSPDGRIFPLEGDVEKVGSYPPNHNYTGGIGESQTGYLLALYLDLVPGDLRAKAAEHLVRKIGEKNWHLSSGFIGGRLLNPVLSGTGYNDVAYKLLLTDTYPSWLYPVTNGATTIWERWDGWTKEKGFQDPLMNSFNHYSLGAVGEWLYGYVAGIDTDPAAPGYKRIVIRPCPGAGLDYAHAVYESIHGRIVSGWKLEGSTFTLDVTIPPNTTAAVWVPSDEGSAVTESGVPAGEAEGVTFTGREAGRASFEVLSGTYRFTSTVSHPKEL